MLFQFIMAVSLPAFCSILMCSLTVVPHRQKSAWMSRTDGVYNNSVHRNDDKWKTMFELAFLNEYNHTIAMDTLSKILISQLELRGAITLSQSPEVLMSASCAICCPNRPGLVYLTTLSSSALNELILSFCSWDEITNLVSTTNRFRSRLCVHSDEGCAVQLQKR